MPALLQVTIGTSATRFTTSTIAACHVIIEADDGNSNAAFIGDSTVTTANGIRLTNSATVPGRMELGPFQSNLLNLSDLYAAGTQNEKVNVLYVQC